MGFFGVQIRLFSVQALFCVRTEFCVSPPEGKHIFQGTLQYVSVTCNEDRDTVLCGPLHLVADARQLLVTVGAA